jgi:hypothetical protein
MTLNAKKKENEIIQFEEKRGNRLRKNLKEPVDL